MPDADRTDLERTISEAIHYRARGDVPDLARDIIKAIETAGYRIVGPEGVATSGPIARRRQF
jgi:hypothetical protein